MVLYIATGDYMILYRDMMYDEYKKILDGEQNTLCLHKNTIKENTFNYRGNMAYMHFFKYLEHARNYISIFGQFIVKCDIPNELIEEFGYGFYRYKGFSEYVPIPEFIIKRESFSTDFIQDINPTNRDSNNILGIREFKLYNMLLKELYIEWKKNNGCYVKDYDFCNYVLDYFKDKKLDNILNDYASLYLEGYGRVKKR